MLDVPDEVPRIVRDAQDDYLIACALAGNAEFLVSGDKNVLTLKAVENLKMISAKRFLEILGNGP